MYILFDPEGELPEQLHKFSDKVGESEAGKKTPHVATSGHSGPRGDVPSFVSASQYHDLADHGFKLSGGYQAFMDSQAETPLCLLRESLITADGPRMPVETTDELPARAYHDPKVLEKAEKLRRQFEELKKHGVRVGTLEDFLEAHGVKVGK